MASATAVPMVGRKAELQALLDAYAEGRRGAPRAVVVRGEAGIGKTRLLGEFRAVTRAPTPGPPVVEARGQCVDLGPIGAPFTPIRRVLHDIHSAVGDDEFRAAAGSPSVIATLAALLPELVSDTATTPSGGDYVAEAIERVIENLSESFHLLLVIEDLHWADAATLALLKTLAVTLRGRHVTLICTYRSDDVGRGHPLRAVLAELDRSRMVTGVEIGRLRADEIAEQVSHLSGGAVSIAQLEAVTARSEGVPFFVEELLELTDQALPDTLRDVVLARFERLSPAAKDVVGLLAVGGVHVDAELLDEVYTGDRRALRDGLREAVAEAVLVIDDRGYTFRHALIQEAVHDDLLPNERAEAHGAYARALQRRVDEGEVAFAAEAAVHWLAARDLTRAFDATVVAREWSDAANAPAASVKLGERLLELWSQIPDARERAGVSRADLARSIAEDYADIGEFERALRSAQAGARFTEPDERLLRAELLRLVGVRQRTLGRDAEAIASLRAARDLLTDSGGPQERALLAKVDALLALSEWSAESSAILDNAVSLAESSDDADALATTLNLRAWGSIDTGALDRAAADLRRAFALPADVGVHYIAANNLVDTLGRLGRFREAVEIGRATYDETVQAGRERGLGASIAANIAELEVNLGDADAGVARAERCLALFPVNPFFESFALRTLALSALWNDRGDAAREYRERAAGLEPRIGVDPDETIGWTLIDALTAVREAVDGAPPAQLRDHAQRIADRIDDNYPGLSFRLLPIAGWICSLAPETRGPLARGIDALSAQLTDGPAPAMAAVARAFLDGGAESWRAALTLEEPPTNPVYYVHLARLELARSLIADGDRDQARDLLAQVIAEAPAMGVALIARWARELASRAGFAPAGADAAPNGSGGGSAVAALTPRERQVLALLAEGLTNPEIGRRLFISPKTASVHVSAILAKIGAANRTEAAALYAASATSESA